MMGNELSLHPSSGNRNSDEYERSETSNEESSDSSNEDPLYSGFTYPSTQNVSHSNTIYGSRIYTPLRCGPSHMCMITSPPIDRSNQLRSTPGEGRLWDKLQRPYDTKKDKQRLGRWFPGGSLTVTEEEKRTLDAKQQKRNRKK